MDPQIRHALEHDTTIDIVTTGAKTGLPRTIEIWFVNIDGRIVITGTATDHGGPIYPRDWLANMAAHPEFTFRLKQSVHADLRARAHIITGPDDRRAILTAPETSWYREQEDTLEQLLAHAPVVEVEFLDIDTVSMSGPGEDAD